MDDIKVERCLLNHREISSLSAIYSSQELSIKNRIGLLASIHHEDRHDCVEHNSHKHNSDPDGMLSVAKGTLDKRESV